MPNSSRPADPVGTLELALSRASKLLTVKPALAAEQACEILRVIPGQPQAMLLLAMARRDTGNTDEALSVLQALCVRQPGWAAAHHELGIVLAIAGNRAASVEALRRAVVLSPESPQFWLALADQLSAGGNREEADAAFTQYTKTAIRDRHLLQAAAAMGDNRIPEAQALLQDRLSQYPRDVSALRMLAEVVARKGQYGEAEQLLEHCLELAPGFDAARQNYATVLNRQRKSEKALAECARLLIKDPRNPGYRSLQAAALADLGNYAQAITSYESVLEQHPQQARLWVSYGHALKTTGRTAEGTAAYRRAISIEPNLGEAYWSLANLKTFQFSDSEVAAMQRALERDGLGDEDRLHFEFALGKALEDAASYEESFAHYAAGNALRRKARPYDAEGTARFVHAATELFTQEFFASRAGYGARSPEPIFIVGLPRAGSTLLEQILASHPLVEGTMELPELPRIARELAGGDGHEDDALLQAIAALPPDGLHEFGERYLAATRHMRKTDAPFFIDKMPNNWLYIGLIQLILPNATIIDMRRNPLGCCFSCFKQHFARGQSFTYGLEDLGRFYRNYVQLMAHFDSILPGRVIRVHYETLIDDTDTEVRRVLAACRLAFDPACLRFHENARAVRTASSEQVRQPIFREGIEHWRHYERWLGTLKATLGSTLTEYPEVSASLWT